MTHCDLDAPIEDATPLINKRYELNGALRAYSINATLKYRSSTNTKGISEVETNH